MIRLLGVIVLIAAGAPAAALGGEIQGTVELPAKAPVERVVVYLDGVKGSRTPPAERPEMNHVDLRFSPDTLAVLKGTTIAFPNSDRVLHSAFSLSKSNPFDLGIYGQGPGKTVTFRAPGLVEVFCHLHSQMRAFIVVFEHPYFAVPARDGRFTIPNVPDGDHRLVAWRLPGQRETTSVAVRGAQAAVVRLSVRAD